MKRDTFLVGTLATLAELFPAILVVDHWRPHKPLAIGVDAQLVATGLVKGHEVAAVLRMYCRRRTYQLALSNGGPRFNLDGSVAGEVSAENIASAKAALLDMDQRAIRSAETAKAARQAERAARDAEKAKEAAEWFAERQAPGRP
jgi:sRNA-binding protein